jgi:CO dehydrogenase nickel-insertion accessory protein CooC1
MMPKLLREIVVSMVSDEQDMQIVGETAGTEDLSEVIHDTEADVVIVACDASEVGRLGRIVTGTPPVLLAIIDDGQRGLLHELRLQEVEIGELTPGALVAAIRNLTPPAGEQ